MERSNDAEPVRAPLSRERVLHEAIALVDESGLDALSMRRLARRLGVEAMSLYNHVANKDEILDGIIDAVVDEIEHPADAPDWQAAIRRNSTSTRDMFLRHRWASGLWMSRQGGGAARMRHGDWILRTLREGGLPGEVVYHAFHLLEAYVLGYAALQLSVPYEGEELAGMARKFLERFPSDDYPDLAEHIRQHVDPDYAAGKGGFELGLDLILDGLERSRGPSTRSGPRPPAT